jgi:hypothetical protein
MPTADRILTPWAKLRHSTMHLCFIFVSAMRQRFDLWSAAAGVFKMTKDHFLQNSGNSKVFGPSKHQISAVDVW